MAVKALGATTARVKAEAATAEVEMEAVRGAGDMLEVAMVVKLGVARDLVQTEAVKGVGAMEAQTGTGKKEAVAVVELREAEVREVEVREVEATPAAGRAVTVDVMAVWELMVDLMAGAARKVATMEMGASAGVPA